jgi:hypothetical protein
MKHPIRERFEALQDCKHKIMNLQREMKDCEYDLIRLVADNDAYDFLSLNTARLQSAINRGSFKDAE